MKNNSLIFTFKYKSIGGLVALFHFFTFPTTPTLK
ncbi:hypothetical protein HH_1125 [Helicobacter hepaticus ATCC 51449]|uniref:Uncharacterized protein n=1 Tax=Helicobacter hepaticus (strain ATCC 51449 / 3B1) TaxID=235279 RepID=Q7VH42_HELHP|nr:hypothetical protein HH_1125 [Helicobacter hepaticus ATCC 51449]